MSALSTSPAGARPEVNRVRLSSLAPERTDRLNHRIRSVRPSVCLERARIVTESYAQTEGQPPVLRRARALKAVLEQMTIFIEDDELIVGNHASRLRSTPLYPEFGSFSREELELMNVRQVDRLDISAADIDFLVNELYPRWAGKSTSDMARGLLDPAITAVLDSEYRPFDPRSRAESGYGHYLPDIANIIANGFESVAREASAHLDDPSGSDPDADAKRSFYEAVLVVVEGVKAFQNRFSDLAEGMAAREPGEVRADELRLIAENCRRVPLHPARTFFEAAQSYWFTLLIDYCSQNGGANSAGRLDQYMYPYLEADLRSGTLGEPEANTILQALWVKHMDLIKAKTYSSARNNGGFATTIGLSLGGVDADGHDAVNKLSYMCLDAEEAVFNSEPNVTIRVNPVTPDAFVDRVLEILARKEGGKDPFFNDQVIIPALMRDHGLTLTEARDWAIVGCVEPTGQGNTMGRTNSCYFNLAKCLELALNDGQCPVSGAQLGPKTGAFRDTASFEELKEAYSKQVDYFVEMMVCSLNTVELLHAREAPHIYCSLLIDGCLESGRDCTDHGALHDSTGVNGAGLADVADSLGVIRALVFDADAVGRAELLDALKADFGERALLRQKCLNVPKYGNDDPVADELVAFVAHQFSESVRRHTNAGGGHYFPGLFCLSSNTPLGRQVGALPSGRQAFQPLADGGISPKHGMDVNGPTAVFKSVASWNQAEAINGVCLNLKFLPSLLKDRSNRQKIVDAIRVYFGLGGMHVQFNVVSAETLRAAQERPEEYRSLVVRVAGYSAFFVELDREIQDELIARTSHEGA
jgi:pyruvate formate-lyase/glycerol dehydratase family glycyl radical enzyme